jgi:hypothetical protein
MKANLRPTARAILVLLVGLAGCSVASVETPDPAAIPTASLEAHGPAATGPIVELGSDVTLEHGWRYGVYPSDEGWCTQLETGPATTTGCGEILPEEGRAFGSVGSNDPAADGVTIVEGITTAETATVWLVVEGGRVPATLMSLEPAGLEGQGFVGFAPPGITVTHVMAVAFNGEVLETYELP